MSAALGRLRNAPLAYVVAQVRFEPYLEIEKAIPALQSSLRKKYPKFLQTEQVGFQLLPQKEPQLHIRPITLICWSFCSISNRTSVTVQQDSLIFQATEYETYETFGQTLKEVVRQVGEHISQLFVNRIGLRYIDFILPNSGETPEDYLVPQIRCNPAPGLPYEKCRGIALAEYQLENGMLAVRCLREMGQPALPPDLDTLPKLEPSVIMQRTVPVEQPTAVLDIDRSMPLSMAYDADQLAECFKHQLHKDTEAAFKAMTTDHARTVWSGEPPT